MDNKYYLDQNGLKALINKSVGLGNYFISINLDSVTWSQSDPTIIDQSEFTANGQTAVQFMRFNDITSIVDVTEYGAGYVKPKIGLGQSVFVNCFNQIFAIKNTIIENGSRNQSEIFKLCDTDSRVSRGSIIASYIYRNDDNSREFVLTVTSTGIAQQTLVIAYKDVLNNSERNIIYVDASIDTSTPSSEIAAGTLQIDDISLVHMDPEGNTSVITDQWTTVLDGASKSSGVEVELHIPGDDYEALILDDPNIASSGADPYTIVLHPSEYRGNAMIWVSDPISNTVQEDSPLWIFKIFNYTQVGANGTGLAVERIQPIAPSDIVTELNYNGPYTVTLKNTGNYTSGNIINKFQVNDVDVTSPSLNTPVSIQRGDKVYVKFTVPAATPFLVYRLDPQVTQDNSYDKYNRLALSSREVQITIPSVKGNSTIDAKATSANPNQSGGGSGGGTTPIPGL